MKRKGFLLAVFLALAAGLVLMKANSAPAAGTATISGQWSGSFSYDDPRYAGQKGDFTMNLTQKYADIDGRTAEPRTFFGPASESMLGSAIVGTYDSTTGNIWFIKTYDYDGHHILYTGTFDASGNSASGTWRIGDYTGTWHMNRTK